MRKVWRIEFEDGSGIYHIADRATFEAMPKYLPNNGENGPRQVTASMDPAIRDAIDRYEAEGKGKKVHLWNGRWWFKPATTFGFTTLEQYRTWFNTEERARIASFPFKRVVLSQYDVPEEHLVRGETQCMWDTRAGRRVAIYSPDHFDKQELAV